MFDRVGVLESILERAHAVMKFGAYVIELAPRIIHVSPELARMLAIGTEAVAMPLADYHRRFHCDGGAAERDRVYAVGETGRAELEQRRATGEIIAVRAAWRVDLDQHDGAIVVGVIEDVARTDITAREEAEDLLRRSEQRFRILIEEAPVALGIQRDGKLIYANRRYLAQRGYDDLSEILGRPVADMWDRPHAADITAFVHGRDARSQADSFDATARRKDGSTFPAHADAVTVELPDGTAHVAFITDLTERRRAEQAERDSEERLRQIAETIEEVFWMTDAKKSEILYISPAYQKIWGRPLGDLAASAASWLEAVHPDDRARVREAAMTKQTRGDYDEHYRIVRPDGALRWIHDRAYPVFDRDGRVERVVGTATDVTAQRELEAQLRQSQKMEAVGVLAGGIAHDFNNLLSVILGYSHLALDDLAADDPLRTDLEDIKLAAERASQLTHQLLAFSRRQILQPRNVDLNEVLVGATKMLRRMIGEDIQLETIVDDHPARAFVDSGQIEQVLMNLAVNARDAMPAGGTLTIGVGLDRIDELAAAPLGLAPGTYVALTVADTGVGMGAEVKGRIFEPFFTTKAVGKGTGLGLSTVFGIVQQSNGHIGVDSTPGGGTTFRIRIPATDTAAGTRDPSAEDRALAGRETILLVEDEEVVRKLARTVLGKAGYRVLEAKTAGDAVVLCERTETPIDLVLTDVVMPLLSGDQLATRLRAMRPALRVLFMSGYPDRGGAAHAIDPDHFLQKPFTPTRLLQHVRAVLSRPA